MRENGLLRPSVGSNNKWAEPFIHINYWVFPCIDRDNLFRRDTMTWRSVRYKKCYWRAFRGVRDTLTLYDVQAFITKNMKSRISGVKMKPADMMNSSRKMAYYFPRICFVYICLGQNHRVIEIARYLDKDHSTICNCREIAQDFIDTKSVFGAEILRLFNLLSNR